MRTDYTPGDFPVPLGMEVYYFGSQRHGLYEVACHLAPEDHPDVSNARGALYESYPDGVAYELWPVGLPKKLGNRHLGVYFARRTSFRVA